MATDNARKPQDGIELERCRRKVLRGAACEGGFNTAEHNRNLRKLLADRSKGAVQRKHQNISAILIELGLPYVDGYKPLGNYEKLLLRRCH